MSAMTHVAIVGAGGRMGGSLMEQAEALSDLQIVAAIDRPGSGRIGSPLGPRGLIATGELSEVVHNAHVVVDFSTPESCLRAASIAANAGLPFVSGTTGLSPAQLNTLREHTESVPVLLAANFSVGVNLLEELVELAARATGPSFDLEVMEAHHRRKVDAPSGTALFLGRAAARGRGLSLDDATWSRHGHTGERGEDTIGFQVIRGGDIVGEHTVMLCGTGERLELTHRATDRGIFAAGALRAARWLRGRPPGWYTMRDVLFG